MPKKILIIIILMVCAALGWALIFYVKNFRGGPAAENTRNAENAEINDKINKFDAALKTMGQTDSDLDGLSNAEEQKYGTNSASSDTDKDGILDKDEINLYKTDPLKADTDGDGLGDGRELRMGRDPLKKNF